MGRETVFLATDAPLMDPVEPSHNPGAVPPLPFVRMEKALVDDSQDVMGKFGAMVKFVELLHPLVGKHVSFLQPSEDSEVIEKGGHEWTYSNN